MSIKIGGATLNQTPIDWGNNLQNIKDAIEQAKKDKIDILCFPELCISGYGCEDLFLNPWVLDTSMDCLKKVIRWTEHIAVCVGLPLVYEEKVYNALCFIVNQEIKGFYLKQFLPLMGVHYETRWFKKWTPGTVSTIILDEKSYPIGHFALSYKGLNLAFEICQDAWGTEKSSDYLATPPDIIFNMSASHFSFGKQSLREELVVNNSKLYDCLYIYTNQLGNESGNMIYDGGIIIGQKGNIVYNSKRFSFKPFEITSIVIDEFDSTPIFYHSFNNVFEEFTQAACLALFDYLRKSKNKGFVLSLSGGADSGSIAILVAEMIKKGVKEFGVKGFGNKLGDDFENKSLKEITHTLLTTAYQSTKNSSKETYNAAKSVAEEIGSVFYSWNIDENVELYTSIIEKKIQRKLNWIDDDLTLQNIQARARSPIIWMLSNIKNSLLLTTGNRSEANLGYTTIDGDTSGSIAPIGGVSKIFILDWLKYAEEKLGYQSLKYINCQVPKAELRPKDFEQNDEKDLMPYVVIQAIEREAILFKKSPIEVFQVLKTKYNPEDLKIWIKKFFSNWAKNQWKRERMAPCFHFDNFNIYPKNWLRVPILSGMYKKELQQLENEF